MKKIVVFALFLAVSLVFAQVPGPKDPNVPGQPENRGEMKQMKNQESDMQKEFLNNVEDLKVAKLKRALDLTPEQAGKFFETYYSIDKFAKEQTQKKNQLTEELGRLLRDEKTDENVLREKTEALERFESESIEKDRELKNKLREGLTVKQRAKLIQFDREFSRNMREMLKGMMKDNKGGNQNQGRNEQEKRKEMMNKNKRDVTPEGRPGEPVKK